MHFVNILLHEKDNGDYDISNSLQHIYNCMKQAKLLTEVRFSFRTIHPWAKDN